MDSEQIKTAIFYTCHAIEAITAIANILIWYMYLNVKSKNAFLIFRRSFGQLSPI